MKDKVKCLDCGTMVLRENADGTGGLCNACFDALQKSGEPFSGFAQFDTFMQHKHFEKALSIVQKIVDKRTKGWQRALPFMISCLSSLGLHEDICKLLKKNHDTEKSLLFEATEAILQAFWNTGQTKEVATWFADYCGLTFGVSDEYYASAEKPLNLMFPARQLVAENMLNGITPRVSIEYILPLLAEARQITAAFGDEIFTSESDSGELTHLVIMLWQRFGIYCVPMTSLQIIKGTLTILFKMYFTRDQKAFKALRKLKAEYFKHMHTGSIEEACQTLFCDEGMLLGFPQCCVKRFAEARSGKDSEPYEKIVSLEALEWRQKHHDKIPETLSSYEFYPCHPECKPACERAESMDEKYLKYDEMALEIHRRVMLETYYNQITEWFKVKTPSCDEGISEKICEELELPWPGLQAVLTNLQLQACNYEA